MIVIYKELPENSEFSKLDVSDPILVLVNGKHWFVKSFSKKSIYMGYWIEKDGQFYKLISDLNFLEEVEKIEVIDEKTSNLYLKDNNILTIKLEKDYLNIEALKPVFLEIYFDIRKLYSNINEGQVYRCLPNEKYFHLIFLQTKENFELGLKIEFDGELQFVHEFVEQEFDYDKERNSKFYKFKILKAFKGYITQLKIFPEFENIKEIEIEEYQSPNYLKNFVLRRILSLFDGEKFRAGLFWFPQRWFRDELLTLIFLNYEEKLTEIKNKIFQYYLSNLDKIWNKNKEFEPITTVDTLLLLINAMDQKIIEENYQLLLDYFRKWQKEFFKKEIFLPTKSTWMDTKDRKVAFEIDLMYLKTLEKLNLIDEFKKYKVYLKTKIFSNSYPDKELFSPNVFLGYYFYNNFFEEHEWFKIFNKVIEDYYLDWGGFSTENKRSPEFQEFYTGENAISYHSGDSWFWINNLAAYVLKNFAYKKYEEYIKKIIEASLINLFKLGSLGYMSELSSASELKFEGCPVQLWSLSSLYLCL